jgi:MFS family permease
LTTERQKPPDLRRNVYSFGITSLLNDTASEMAYWVIPAFLVSIGAGPAALGLIEGIAESVASFAKLFSGYFADRVARRKPLVISGYAVANLAKPFLAIATAWWHVLMVRFADRLAKGVRGAPRDVMLSESVPKAGLGGAFGLLQAMDTAGAIVGPLIALFLLHLGHGLRTIFWIAAIPGLASIVVVWLLVRETRATSESPERREDPAQAKTGLGWGTRGRGALPGSFYYVVIAVSLFSIGNSSDMFLVLRAQDVGIAAAFAPAIGLVFNVVYTATSWPAGRLSDRISKRRMAAAGYVVFAIVYAVFAWAPSRAAIWGAFAFYGLYYSLTNPVLRALVAQTIAPELRGRAFGVFYFATSVAALLASVITGEMWKHFGAPLPFYLSAGLAVVAAGMLLVSDE